MTNNKKHLAKTARALAITLAKYAAELAPDASDAQLDLIPAPKANKAPKTAARAKVVGNYRIRKGGPLCKVVTSGPLTPGVLPQGLVTYLEAKKQAKLEEERAAEERAAEKERRYLAKVLARAGADAAKGKPAKKAKKAKR